MNYDDWVLIYQLNLTNGDNINSRYRTSYSWSVPYDTLFYNNKVYIMFRCPPNSYLCKHGPIIFSIVVFDTLEDQFENYRFLNPHNPYFLLKDPFAER